MAYLMEIAFDNSRRLRRKRYLFEYRGIRFKLVQDNPRQWADHLLSVIPSDDRIHRERVFAAASEFLSALAWENGARVMLWQAGGLSWRDDLPLRRTRPFTRDFPRIPFGGNIVGHDLLRIPEIRTNEQRIALALYREARATNNDYLSFLFYWQVLEVAGENPEQVVNKIMKRHRARLRLEPGYIARLPLRGQTLGGYLREDCRDAIAHIRRRRGRTPLDLDKPSERMRLAISTHVVAAFAEEFIREGLGLTADLYLVRPRGGGFPVYMDSAALRTGHFEPVRPAGRVQLRSNGRRPRRLGRPAG